MFLDFFYLLRQRGLAVSVQEWQDLLSALEKGLHRSSLTGFYYLCRSVLIKRESDFDRFDQVFLEYFKGVHYEETIPSELMDWLNHPTADPGALLKELEKSGFPSESIEELLKELEKRIKEQDSEHNGGNYWVGTHGRSPFGNSGWHPNGIRIGGESHYRTAMAVAGERKFRDFRKDNTLDTRQFQMAFRALRQNSIALSQEKELDVDGTIHETCEQGGTLSIQYSPKRKNSIKLLMFIDSGGSMDIYGTLCSTLFQAAINSNHFKELHTFYFHNCIYDNVYPTPELLRKDAVPCDYIYDNFDSEYRVIMVGDAMMNEAELMGRLYDWGVRGYSKNSGMMSLKDMISHYPYIIWLNPEPFPDRLTFWSYTYLRIAEMFDMYPLSSEGLESGVRHLLSKHRSKGTKKATEMLEGFI